MKRDVRGEILDYIRGYYGAHGYCPSVRDIGSAVGLRSTATVHYHLRLLAEAGELRMEPGKKRAITLAEPEQSAADSRPVLSDSVPVLGAVAAGQPIPAVEQIEDYVPWEDGAGCFGLRVRGDSMKNIGILPGDTVIVRPQPTAENGEIVVALLGDEATVKRFSRRDGHVRLLPENEAYAPIDGDDAAIVGVVRGVVRRYD